MSTRPQRHLLRAPEADTDDGGERVVAHPRASETEQLAQQPDDRADPEGPDEYEPV